MADTADLKSVAGNTAWGFESPLSYPSKPEIKPYERNQPTLWSTHTLGHTGAFDTNSDTNERIYRFADAGATMSYQVTVKNVAARPTAVVSATTTWQEFPTLWQELSAEVWACLRAGGISSGCRNIMLYWDDVPHVEVGAELLVPCPLTGRVVASTLPAGQVAMTTHWGAYSELGAAHQAVIDWLPTQGKRMTGARWEVYGPHNDDPDKVWTEVYYLLA